MNLNKYGLYSPNRTTVSIKMYLVLGAFTMGWVGIDSLALKIFRVI
jgi:hypothetical protein